MCRIRLDAGWLAHRSNPAKQNPTNSTASHLTGQNVLTHKTNRLVLCFSCHLMVEEPKIKIRCQAGPAFGPGSEHWGSSGSCTALQFQFFGQGNTSTNWQAQKSRLMNCLPRCKGQRARAAPFCPVTQNTWNKTIDM